MMQIALCDDDQTSLNFLEEKIIGYAKEKKMHIRIDRQMDLNKYAALTEIEKRKSISYLARTKYTWSQLTQEAKQMIKC